MHISLVCQTIAYVLRSIDMMTISLNSEEESQKSFSELSEEERVHCQISGSLQILFETFGYINLATYLFLLRHSVAHATADHKCVRIKLTVFSVGISILCWLCILAGPKIQLESTLSCGVQYSADFTEYTELARNWQIILVPYLLWKSVSLTKSVPGFIKQSFSYYALQVIFYVAVFAVRMTISFSLQFASVSVLEANKGQP